MAVYSVLEISKESFSCLRYQDSQLSETIAYLRRRKKCAMGKLVPTLLWVLCPYLYKHKGKNGGVV